MVFLARHFPRRISLIGRNGKAGILDAIAAIAAGGFMSVTMVSMFIDGSKYKTSQDCATKYLETSIAKIGDTTFDSTSHLWKTGYSIAGSAGIISSSNRSDEASRTAVNDLAKAAILGVVLESDHDRIMTYRATVRGGQSDTKVCRITLRQDGAIYQPVTWRVMRFVC